MLQYLADFVLSLELLVPLLYGRFGYFQRYASVSLWLAVLPKSFLIKR
jgi:hypothetical protein